MKRTMDLVGGMMALILFSPVMLVTAILIKATSPGPVIFCQERVGLHNKPFKMYKFRSWRYSRRQRRKASGRRRETACDSDWKIYPEDEH